MIEDGEVDGLTGARELACRVIIRLAGSGIAAGMIVGDHDPRAAKPSRIGDYVSHRNADRRRFALILVDMKAARLIIDMSHQQQLERWVDALETGGEKAASGLMAVKKRGRFGTLIPHGRNLFRSCIRG